MKFVSAGILACIIVIHGAAQVPSSQSQPSCVDVTIRKRGTFSKAGKAIKKSEPADEAKLDSVFTADGSSKPFPQSDVSGDPPEGHSITGFPRSTGSQPTRNNEPEIMIGVTNRATKKILHIEWQIIFNDLSKTIQAEPLRFTDRITITPGAMRPLVRWKDLKYIPATLHEFALSGRLTWCVVITQIRYEDGSVWKAQP